MDAALAAIYNETGAAGRRECRYRHRRAEVRLGHVAINLSKWLGDVR